MPNKQGPSYGKPMSYDEYLNKRSWLIDTAETKQDQRNLKADLAKLDSEFKAGQRSSNLQGKRFK